jgi:metallo-beta-lactamase family protein
MKIQFLGGAGTVTGSKTLIESGESRILIDCGLFQGIKPLRELNWEPLAVLPSSIDAVVLTHGHLDHCGWLPRLVAQGFTGKIYCSAPTAAIAKLILLDSGKIQEEDANRANEEHYSKHELAKPLYTVAEAEAVFKQFTVVPLYKEHSIAANVTVMFSNAGHILGACSLVLRLEGKTLAFSGDIGRNNDVLMYAPDRPDQADYVFLESTYGNRLHPQTDPKTELETCLNATLENGGTVIIPSFAVERAQSIMYLLWQLRKENKIPNVPYVIDTPMGVCMLDLFAQNQAWHKLSLEDYQDMCAQFTINADFEDTIATVYNKAPKVIIAASGMLTGGRVLRYLETYISKPETTVLLIGYQAEGTRGRKLLEGATEIKLRGRFYDVHARVIEIQGLSAHGDQTDLVNWLSNLSPKPKEVFLVHGENQAADELRIKIQEKYGVPVRIPLLGQSLEL